MKMKRELISALSVVAAVACFVLAAAFFVIDAWILGIPLFDPCCSCGLIPHTEWYNYGWFAFFAAFVFTGLALCTLPKEGAEQ